MVRISPTTEADVPLILGFIRKLADYEKLSHAAVATEDDLREHLFGPRPMAEVILAYWNDAPAGFALFFHNFSTFVGKPGIYLEDLFVEPELRGHGIGRALLVHLAQLARGRRCGRLEWSVLNWNEPAIGFYQRIGAVPMNEWTTYRLDSAGIEKLAAS
jgi:GNAT superfamily N-acetyltransferase